MVRPVSTQMLIIFVGDSHGSPHFVRLAEVCCAIRPPSGGPLSFRTVSFITAVYLRVAYTKTGAVIILTRNVSEGTRLWLSTR